MLCLSIFESTATEVLDNWFTCRDSNGPWAISCSALETLLAPALYCDKAARGAQALSNLISPNALTASWKSIADAGIPREDKISIDTLGDPKGDRVG